MGIPVKVMVCYVNFVLLLVTGVLVSLSGFVLWLILPRGQVRSRFSVESTFLELSRGTWEDIHLVAGLLFMVLTVVHLMLNWAWIKNVTTCLIRTLIRRQRGDS